MKIHSINLTTNYISLFSNLLKAFDYELVVLFVFEFTLKLY